MSTIDAGAEPAAKPQKTKPEKPDEQKYKEELAKAEKEHAAAQEKVVCLFASSGASDFPLAQRFWRAYLDHKLMPFRPECDQGKNRLSSTLEQRFPLRQKTART